MGGECDCGGTYGIVDSPMVVSLSSPMRGM
jgi:hypothetical protein